jgi:WD40 repeat protein
MEPRGAALTGEAVLSKDGKIAATAATDQGVAIWDTSTGKQVCRLRGHSTAIRSIAISSDGKLIITLSLDGMAILWETRTGSELRRLTKNDIDAYVLSFSPDDKTILTATGQTAVLWDAQTGNDIGSFTGKGLRCIAFSPDGQFLATIEYDEDAKADLISLRKTASYEVISKFLHNMHEEELVIECVRFSHDGRRILTVDKFVRIWDLVSGKEIKSVGEHVDSFGIFANKACFSPDGKTILASAPDNTARLWDVETGAEVRRFEGHSDHVICVDISADGRLVMTGGYDHTVRLWDNAS